jgi:hypothetical protein
MMVVDASPVSVDGGVVLASHTDAGIVKRFGGSAHEQRINAALAAVVGLPLRLRMGTGVAGQGQEAPAAEPGRQTPSEGGLPPGQSSVESEVAGSSDVDDLSGIELAMRELGATTIEESDRSNNV